MSNIEKLKEYVMPNGIYKNTRANSVLIKKYFTDIYETIKDDYKIKLYMLLHDIDEIPKCKNEMCVNKVKLENIGAGFRQFCCNKCIAEFQKTDKDFGNKISNTKQKKSKSYFIEKYPDINFTYDKSNKNYCKILNYCKHGDIRIYNNSYKKNRKLFLYFMIINKSLAYYTPLLSKVWNSIPLIPSYLYISFVVPLILIIKS
jgi:hypothetical protein